MKTALTEEIQEIVLRNRAVLERWREEVEKLIEEAKERRAAQSKIS